MVMGAHQNKLMWGGHRYYELLPLSLVSSSCLLPAFQHDKLARRRRKRKDGGEGAWGWIRESRKLEGSVSNASKVKECLKILCLFTIRCLFLVVEW